MEFFNGVLPYTNGASDKLASFDGHVAVSTVANESENGTRTIISFRRVTRPIDKKIGDEDGGEFSLIPGYAFHFAKVESVQVVIDALNEIKASMLEALVKRDAQEVLEKED